VPEILVAVGHSEFAPESWNKVYSKPISESNVTENDPGCAALFTIKAVAIVPITWNAAMVV
jgi:hypothetical protein